MYHSSQVMAHHHTPSHAGIPHLNDYTRPRVATSFLQDISQLVASSISPVDSESSTGTTDNDRALSSPISRNGDSGSYQYVTDPEYNSATPPEPFESGPSYGSNHHPASSYAQHSSPARTPSFPQPQSAPHLQTHFQPAYQIPSSGDRFASPVSSEAVRFTPTEQNMQSTPSNSLLEHRRMSEPALFASASYSGGSAGASVAAARYQNFHYSFGQPTNYSPNHTLHRAATSTSSLRDQFAYSAPQWKQEQTPYNLQDEPISPHHTQPQYSTIPQDRYGDSPPGTGTSSSSGPRFGSVGRSVPLPPVADNEDADNFVDIPSSKTFSFVALPGNSVKKRPRRRYDEIERLYRCSWGDCDKAYGTLNHLNAHVTMQKHGTKRSPEEFKELRKQWRKESKERKQHDDQRRNGLLRRASMGMLQDHTYEHRHQRMRFDDSVSPELPSRQPRAHGSMESMHSARYRDEIEYSGSVRQRYATTTPAQWHPVTHSSSHSSLNQQYEQAEPSMPVDSSGSNLSHLNLSLHIPSSQQFVSQSLPAQSHMIDTLPANSTLLTPLPGYEPTRMIRSPQIARGMNYSQESYDSYDEGGN